jgi:hypothetical protein
MAHHPTDDARPRAALPVDRSFVVQLRADADVGGGVVTGRIEHVTSGVATHFESVEQLIAWMRDVVGRPGAQGREKEGP